MIGVVDRERLQHATRADARAHRQQRLARRGEGGAGAREIETFVAVAYFAGLQDLVLPMQHAGPCDAGGQPCSRTLQEVEGWPARPTFASRHAALVPAGSWLMRLSFKESVTFKALRLQ